MMSNIEEDFLVMIDRCLDTLNHVKLFHIRTYKANENRGESTPSRSAALKQKRFMSDNVHNNWTLG